MTATLALADRLARLERTVATLQQQQPGAESLQANYLTLDPNGQVGADFTGVINALGLILPAGTSSTPTSASRVAWTRTSDGAVVAEAYAYEPAASTLDVGVYAAKPATASNQANAYLLAEHPAVGGAQQAFFLAQRAADGGGDQNTQLTGQVESASGVNFAPLFMDATGKSSFLQLLSAQKLQLQIGTWTTAIGAGGVQGLNIALPTAWPTNHLLFLATCNPNNAFGGWSVVAPGVVIGLGTGQCVISNTNAANTSVSGTWLSLGN